MRTAVGMRIAVAASSALGRRITRTRIACEGRPTERERGGRASVTRAAMHGDTRVREGHTLSRGWCGEVGVTAEVHVQQQEEEQQEELEELEQQEQEQLEQELQQKDEETHEERQQQGLLGCGSHFFDVDLLNGGDDYGDDGYHPKRD